MLLFVKLTDFMAKKLKFQEAGDIQKMVAALVSDLNMNWVKPDRVFCYRSNHSKARAYARIWGLSRIWQISLNLKPGYVIEVLSEKFDHLDVDEKNKILIHELCHIPKNFSGSLLPHTRSRGPKNFERRVHELYDAYLENKRQGSKFGKELKNIGNSKTETRPLFNFLYSKKRSK